ncbi:hypothetical protein [Curtobacterium sp. USHLN213]
MTDYDEWLGQDDPRYVCIEDCPRIHIGRLLVHSAECRDSNLKADAL